MAGLVPNSGPFSARNLERRVQVLTTRRLLPRFPLEIYADAPADSVLYVVAKGGTPKAAAANGPNAATGLMAVLGTTPPEKLTINEFTTIASVWTSYAPPSCGDSLHWRPPLPASNSSGRRGNSPALLHGQKRNETTSLSLAIQCCSDAVRDFSARPRSLRPTPSTFPMA
jgi:hypothetical protein